MRVMTSEKDAKVWIEKLKRRGIREFQFRHLPRELKEIRMVKKSKSLGLITRKTKTEHYRTVWTIL